MVLNFYPLKSKIKIICQTCFSFFVNNYIIGFVYDFILLIYWLIKNMNYKSYNQIKNIFLLVQNNYTPESLKKIFNELINKYKYYKKLWFILLILKIFLIAFLTNRKFFYPQKIRFYHYLLVIFSLFINVYGFIVNLYVTHFINFDFYNEMVISVSLIHYMILGLLIYQFIDQDKYITKENV